MRYGFYNHNAIWIREVGFAVSSTMIPKIAKAHASTTSRRPRDKNENGDVENVVGKRSLKRQRATNVRTGDIEGTPPSEPEARAILQCLQNHFKKTGHPTTQEETPVLDTLIQTILSQATAAGNSQEAFRRLKSRFETWENAESADPDTIANTIKVAGLSRQKSRTIHTILRTLKEEGGISLEHLRTMDDADVQRVLGRFKGVGVKTISCVQMFALRRSEFPVDTHVRRISGRIGWIRLEESADNAYKTLNACLPGDVKYALHVLLIELGRSICKSARPACAICPLRARCATGMRLVDFTKDNDEESEDDVAVRVER